MPLPQIRNLALHARNILLRLLDGSPAVSFPFPAGDILCHFAHSPVLLSDLVANLARGRHKNGLVDELESARLAGAVLLIALLAEVSPLPVAAGPECLFEVAHFGLVACKW